MGVHKRHGKLVGRDLSPRRAEGCRDEGLFKLSHCSPVYGRTQRRTNGLLVHDLSMPCAICGRAKSDFTQKYDDEGGRERIYCSRTLKPFLWITPALLNPKFRERILRNTITTAPDHSRCSVSYRRRTPPSSTTRRVPLPCRDSTTARHEPVVNAVSISSSFLQVLILKVAGKARKVKVGRHHTSVFECVDLNSNPSSAMKRSLGVQPVQDTACLARCLRIPQRKHFKSAE